jgi:hypothetical protein
MNARAIWLGPLTRSPDLIDPQIGPDLMPVARPQVPPRNDAGGSPFDCKAPRDRDISTGSPLPDQYRATANSGRQDNSTTPLLAQVGFQDHARIIAKCCAYASSVTLCHRHSALLSTAAMRTIGAIRRARLAQLLHDKQLTYADINDKLLRNRRDSTLSQIAKGAPDREMGDAQARALETAYGLPEGWFDRDPAFDELEARYEQIVAKLGEPVPAYTSWPFRSVTADRFHRLPADIQLHVETVVLNAVQIWESSAHASAPGPATTSERFG